MKSIKNNAQYIENIAEQETTDKDWTGVIDTTVILNPIKIDILETSTINDISILCPLTYSVRDGEIVELIDDTNNIKKSINLTNTENNSYRNILDILNDNSCIATYTLDGDTNDLSGNYNATSTAIVYGDGKFNSIDKNDKAAIFDGSSSYIVANDKILDSKDTTIAFWIMPYVNTGDTYREFFSQGSPDIFMGFGISNDIRISNHTSISNSLIPVNKYTHVVLVLDSSQNATVYINGNPVLINDPLTDTVPNSYSDNFTLGMQYGSNGEYFSGRIDQVRIFNKALTQIEVLKVMNESLFTLEVNQLTASDAQASDDYGRSVSISDDGLIMLVGAYSEDTAGSGTGKVYEYHRATIDDVWTEVRQLTASDAQTDDMYGTSIALNSDGTVLVVGAYAEDAAANNAGKVYTYKRATIDDNWTEVNQLTASDAADTDLYGVSVAISSDGLVLAVGSNYEDTAGTDAGKVYTYKRATVNDTWTEVNQLTASDAQDSDLYGASVAISSDGLVLVVGAYLQDTAATDAGKVYTYTRATIDDVWTEVNQLTASDAQDSDYFGVSVALSGDGNVLVVGAYGEDTVGDNAGKVYIYKRATIDNSWTEINQLTASDTQANDNYGISVTVNNNATVLIVGSTSEDTAATDAGKVYTYKIGYRYLQNITDLGFENIPNYGYINPLTDVYVSLEPTKNRILALPNDYINILSETAIDGSNLITNNEINVGETVIINGSENIIQNVNIVDNTQNLDIVGDGSCIHAYTLDGNANDLSGDVNGIVSDVEYVKGKLNNALKIKSYLNPVSDTNNVPSGITFPYDYIYNMNQFTFSTIFKLYDSSSPFIFISHSYNGNRSLSIRLTQSDISDYYANAGTTVYPEYTLTIYNGGASNVDNFVNIPFRVTPNEYNLLVVTYDSATTKFEVYLNNKYIGEAVNSDWTNLGSLTTSDIVGVGSHPYTGVSGSGELDQMRIFNKVLNKDEINLLYTEMLEGIKYELDTTQFNLNNKPLYAYKLGKKDLRIETATTTALTVVSKFSGLLNSEDTILVDEVKSSIDTLTETTKTIKNFAKVTYTGNGGVQNIITGINSVDFTKSNNGSGFWFDKTTFEVKDDAGNVVIIGDAIINTSKVHIKNLTEAHDNLIYDSFRGTHNEICTNNANTEGSFNVDEFTGFNSDGVSVAFVSSNGRTNNSGSNYILYQTLYTHIKWGITSHGKKYVEAYNPDTLENMIIYEGSGIGGHQIPHSLNKKLGFGSSKNLTSTASWLTGWLNFDKHMSLDANTTPYQNIDTWKAVSENYISLAGTLYSNALNDVYIFYGKCISENWTVLTYTGTGTGGVVVGTRDINGVLKKPSRFIIKRMDDLGDWVVMDSVRINTSNGLNRSIDLNTANAEIDAGVEISNTGFTVTGTDPKYNTANGEYLVIAELTTGIPDDDCYYDLSTYSLIVPELATIPKNVSLTDRSIRLNPITNAYNAATNSLNITYDALNKIGRYIQRKLTTNVKGVRVNIPFDSVLEKVQ